MRPEGLLVQASERAVSASGQEMSGRRRTGSRSSLRTLLRRARDEGAVNAGVDPEGMAVVVVATLKGTFMLPAPTGERAERTIRQLETLIFARRARASARGRKAR